MPARPFCREFRTALLRADCRHRADDDATSIHFLDMLAAPSTLSATPPAAPSSTCLASSPLFSRPEARIRKKALLSQLLTSRIPSRRGRRTLPTICAISATCPVTRRRRAPRRLAMPKRARVEMPLLSHAELIATALIFFRRLISSALKYIITIAHLRPTLSGRRCHAAREKCITANGHYPPTNILMPNS